MSKNNFSEETKKLMELYSNETGKSPLFRGKLGKSFKTWKKSQTLEETEIVEAVEENNEVEVKAIKVCKICSKEIPAESKRRVFCSPECSYEAKKISIKESRQPGYVLKNVKLSESIKKYWENKRKS